MRTLWNEITSDKEDGIFKNQKNEVWLLVSGLLTGQASNYWQTSDGLSNTETTTQSSAYKKRDCKVLNLNERCNAITERSNKRVERSTDRFYPDEEPIEEKIMTRYHAIFMKCHSKYLKELQI